jgi:Cu/Ag efflux protein CusF
VIKKRRNGMKAAKALILIAVALGAHAATAQPTTNVEVTKGPEHTTITGMSKVTATVVGIDKSTRTVTLRTPKGKVVELEVTNEARNFDQLAIGDVVTVEYREALTVSLMKEKGQASHTEHASEERSVPGAKPGGMVGREVTIVADVVAVDHKAKTVLLKGPKGNTLELKVEDPDRLKRIHKGDQVQAVYTEAFAISVEPAAK